MLNDIQREKRERERSDWMVNGKFFIFLTLIWEREREKRNTFNSFVLKSHCNGVYNFILTIGTNESVLGYLIDRKSSSTESMTDILTQLTGQLVALDRKVKVESLHNRPFKRWKRFIWDQLIQGTRDRFSCLRQTVSQVNRHAVDCCSPVTFHQLLTSRSIDHAINRFVHYHPVEWLQLCDWYCKWKQ